jgi:ribose transport system substrate-binding protein
MLAAGVAGCGDSNETASGKPAGNGTASSSTTTSTAVLDRAKSVVDGMYRGTDRALPASGPAAVPGKKIWYITCSMLTAGCADPAHAAADAGKRIGWDVKIADGKLDPAVFSSQIRAAVADKADGIILMAIDCSSARAAIQVADAAHIPVYGSGGSDCDAEGGKKLFTGVEKYFIPPSKDPLDLITWERRLVGPQMANYVINKTNGTGEVIWLANNDNSGLKAETKGFDEVMGTCTGCKVHNVPFAYSDIGPNMQAITAAALQKYPKADVVAAPIDILVSLGALSAVEQARASGRKIMLLSWNGLPANLELVQKGKQDAVITSPSTWRGWAAIDQLNRIFAGAPYADSGMGEQLFDQSHKPPSTQYDGNARSDWKSNYLKIWQAQ